MLKLEIVLALVFSMSITSFSQACGQDQDDADDASPAALNFIVKSIDGEQVDLRQYQGKVIVVVNVASQCGYTPQYAQLQSLYETYGDQGLVILGFPCNQFRGQEPKSDAEIKEFCTSTYQVTFDMFAKIDVNGEQSSDFFKHLRSLDLPPKGAGDVSWNFEKFIIDRRGVPIARFATKVRPDSEEFVGVIRAALEQRP